MEGYLPRFFVAFRVAHTGAGRELLGDVFPGLSSSSAAVVFVAGQDLLVLISGLASVLEAAATVALSCGCLLPATIVLFADLHYTRLSFTGYGHHTT